MLAGSYANLGRPCFQENYKYNSIITKYARHKHVQKNEIVFKILICANFILNVFSQSILVKINFVTFHFVPIVYSCFLPLKGCGHYFLLRNFNYVIAS